MTKILTGWVGLVFLLLCTPVHSSDEYILLQSTTSTQNSGLYEFLLPHFEDGHGVKVKVVAVGTGQALYNGSRCNGDIVIVHSPADEREFVEAGYGIDPHNLMYNRFVIVGPSSDPAGIGKIETLREAFAKLSKGPAPFVSRGDDSGTHKKELSLWNKYEISTTGDWYYEVGSGMGATLNITVGLEGYTMTDLGTWLSFANKTNHVILYENGSELFNQYGIIMVNPDHCPNVNSEPAREFLNWIVSPMGQQLIAQYKIDGEQLFYPNASPKRYK